MSRARNRLFWRITGQELSSARVSSSQQAAAPGWQESRAEGLSPGLEVATWNGCLLSVSLLEFQAALRRA